MKQSRANGHPILRFASESPQEIIRWRKDAPRNDEKWGTYLIFNPKVNEFRQFQKNNYPKIKYLKV